MKLISVIVVFLSFILVDISMSASAISAASVSHPWDVNGDGVVGSDDLALVGEHFGETQPTTADVNNDGLVDIFDVVLVAIHFGEEYDLEGDFTGQDGAPMVLIPAGDFQMGDALNEGWDDEIPVHTVYVEEFYMDIYEVTNSRYSNFLNEYGKNTDTSGNELLDISSPYCLIEKAGSIYRPKAGYEDHPVVGVSWYGASAYAEFYDKLLPTEAQWEKAARGGLSGKRYPWGNGISHNDANYGGTGGRDTWRETSPVGSFRANGHDLYDMVGNVWEWCADWYDNEYYSVSPGRNPAGPVSGRFRVLRGGSWNDTPDFLRVAARGGESPSYADSVVGFRCIVPEKQ